MNMDWDICSILDGCRYDTFAENSDLTGKLVKKTSRGSNTVEFLRGNFSTGKYHDTVYVTANPQFRRHQEKFEAKFHDVIDVWKDDGWNQTYNTVLPQTTAEYAIQAAEDYPNKRLIVHFIQPHYPFLSQDVNFDKADLHEDSINTDDFWNQIFYGEIDVPGSLIWELYRDNLRSALPHVQELISTIQGKHVVTADHGNMIGDRARPVPIREWGHPEGVHTDKLVSVPWLEYTSEERRRITAENPTVSTTNGQEQIRDRLVSLGYRN